MRLLLGQDAYVAAWAAQRIPHIGPNGFGPCAAIGVVSEAGEVVGGAVFHGYQPHYRAVEISFALSDPRCLNASLIAGIMAYPFDQLHVERVTAVTPRKAASARRFLEKFNFKREGNARRGFGTDDAIIYGLLRSDWRASRFNRAERLGVQERIAPGAHGS